MQDDPDWPEAATILAHDPRFSEGAVVPPIYQTSLFTFESYEQMRATFAGQTGQAVYSRVGNPTTAVFEDKLARLEGAEAARGFASGMAAISGAVLSQVQSGDRLVCVRHVYPDAYRFFEVLLPRMGVRVDYVDGRDPDAVARALVGARVLYLESPTSWVFEVQDLARLTALARREGATTIVDNSWASPIFQRPLAHGADLVLHSASKYLGGHSDTVAGVVAGSAELIGRINRIVLPYLGAKLAPFEAWLLVRGMRTLEIRMRAHERSAIAVATAMREHPAVAARAAPGAGRHGRRHAAHRQLRPVQHRARRRHRRAPVLRRPAPVQAGRQLGRAREPGDAGRGRPRAGGRRAQLRHRFRRRPAYRAAACRARGDPGPDRRPDAGARGRAGLNASN